MNVEEVTKCTFRFIGCVKKSYFKSGDSTEIDKHLVYHQFGLVFELEISLSTHYLYGFKYN